MPEQDPVYPLEHKCLSQVRFPWMLPSFQTYLDETGVGASSVFLVGEYSAVALRGRETSLKGGGDETAGGESMFAP
jgi:hypothetical protein